jgi:hypothetical protein
MTARRARSALLVAVLLALGIAFVPNDAHALDGTAFTVAANKTTEVDEPPIPGNDPASSQGADVVGSPTPDQCSLSPSCMTVPFKVEVPPRNPGDDFVVYLSFTWDQPTGVEDIDFWIYDDGQTDKESGGDGTTYTEIGSSASGDMPEKVKLYEPLFGSYNIVANNFSGPNTGWHIKAESTVGKFEKPFESLAPTANGGSTNPHNKPITTTTTPPSTIATTTTVTVPEGSIIPDDDFEGGKFDNNSYVDQAIAAGQEARASASRKPPSAKSPSAIAVVGWMLVLPAAMFGGGFLALRARRRARYSPASTSST